MSGFRLNVACVPTGSGIFLLMHEPADRLPPHRAPVHLVEVLCRNATRRQADGWKSTTCVFAKTRLDAGSKSGASA